jgi:hypothetical protein
MLDALKSFFGFTVEKSAAAALPPVELPKVPNRQQTVPSTSRRTSSTKGDQKLSETDRRTANVDLLTLRNGTNTKATIRDLSKVSPDLGGARWAYQRLVVTRGFSAFARNLDGTLNADATSLAQQFLNRLNYLTDYTDGFNGMSSVHALAEAWCNEIRINGSCASELVLDKARVPNRVVPISTSQIEFIDDGTGYVYPIQKANGVEINLDTPAFFYEALDQDLLTAYSESPVEAALQPVLADAEFTNDVRRVIKRALHPRLSAKIDLEMLRKNMPLEILNDADKQAEYLSDYVSRIADTVNGLEPDDALVSMNTVEFSYLNNGNVTLNREWETLQAMVNSKLATGAKAPPAVLGHGTGSQNIASTETLLFLRYCEGIQNKINSMMSRILTLAMRLLGQDVYVEFAFERVDLRPESELEAFRTMYQSRILDQLSLGLITDEEASLKLTGRLPPAGAPKLSGTMFRGGASQDPAGNPNSNTSASNAGPRDSKPQTPTQPKGPANKDN